MKEIVYKGYKIQPSPINLSDTVGHEGWQVHYVIAKSAFHCRFTGEICESEEKAIQKCTEEGERIIDSLVF